VWTFWQPPDLRLSGNECQALCIAMLLVLIGATRSIHCLGVHGELFGGMVTRTLAADDRSDTRMPFTIPIDVAHHWNPFGPEGQIFYSPYTFASRGPILGLAATPAVLTWARVPMRRLDQTFEPFQPIDRYGFMQYRFAVIVFAAMAVIPFFVALGGTRLAIAGTAIYALSPFVVHETYFTWAKQATVPLMLSAYCLAISGRPGRAGMLAGLAYITHQSAAFEILAFVPLLVAVGPQPEPGSTISLKALLHPTRWWQSRRSLATFLLALECAVGPWVYYLRDKPDPAGFLNYVYMADSQFRPISGWIASRLQSLASTLVPFYSYVAFHGSPRLHPVFVPPLGIVTFFTQYYFTLPAGVGLVWFFWRLKQLVLAMLRNTGWTVVMLAAPFGIFLVYWGPTVVGLLREGLHVEFAFLMLIWVAFMPQADLTRPLIHSLRTAELLVFIWLPTFVSQGKLASSEWFSTDLPALCANVAAVLLLTRFTRLPIAEGVSSRRSPSTTVSDVPEAVPEIREQVQARALLRPRRDEARGLPPLAHARLL
jgi:hypothetical protein